MILVPDARDRCSNETKRFELEKERRKREEDEDEKRMERGRERVDERVEKDRG